MTAPVETSLLASSADQRKTTRQRVFLSGKVVFGETDLTVDCLIRDLSRTGAKVKLAGVLPLPPDVYLLELKSGMAFESRIVWRRLPEIGLQFINAHKLSDAVDPRILRLKRIWIESVAR